MHLLRKDETFYVKSFDGVELDSNIWQWLSDDHLDRIRAFLPPSSLFRFRCVCRRWNKFMSDPGFLDLYGQVVSPKKSVVLVSRDRNPHRVNAFFLESLRWYRLPLDFLPKEACFPLDADGGLLCLGSSQSGDLLYVCNPLSKSWRQLPDRHARQVVKKAANSHVKMVMDSKDRRSFKVVVVYDPSETHNLASVISVFSSRTGLWSTFENRYFRVHSNLAHASVIRNGIMYWCTLCPDGIQSFDVERRVWNFHRIQFPRLFTPFGESQLVLLDGGQNLGLMGLKVGGRSFALGSWKLTENENGLDAAMWEENRLQSRSAGLSKMQKMWSGLHGFVHEGMLCVASRTGPWWARYHSEENSWTMGEPAPVPESGFTDVHHDWCLYEPNVEVRA